MKNNSQQKETPQKSFWQYIRKNGLSIVFGAGVVVMIASPDAKSWVLKQIMLTGIFNAHIDDKSAGKSFEKVADFKFKDEGGRKANISSLEGKVVFINVWASWCPPCRAEFPSIMSLYDKYKTDPNVYFLMVNEDENVSAAKAFLEKEHYPFPIFKIDGIIPSGVYSGTLPTTVVLDKKSRIRYHHEGFANYGLKKFMKQIEAIVNE